MYFSPMVIEGDDYRDGGMAANNPAMVALDEVKQMHGGLPPGLLLSIGTGRSDEVQPEAPSGGRLGFIDRSVSLIHWH